MQPGRTRVLFSYLKTGVVSGAHKLKPTELSDGNI